MVRCVALVRNDVSEELSASIIRMISTGKLGTLAITSNRRTLRRNNKSLTHNYVHENTYYPETYFISERSPYMERRKLNFFSGYCAKMICQFLSAEKSPYVRSVALEKNFQREVVLTTTYDGAIVHSNCWSRNKPVDSTFTGLHFYLRWNIKYVVCVMRR
jgi:hypothetical protein